MKLYAGGHLDFYLPERRSRMEIEIKEPARLSAVLTGLGIPLAEIHLTLVNGQRVNLLEAVVCNQDEVKFYSAVNGG